MSTAPSPAHGAAALPPVSVVVAAKNASRTVEACLRSILDVDYPDLEMLLADAAATDDPAAIARRLGVRVLDAGGIGPAYGRNLAVKHARGALVAFTDADCTVPRHWLRALVPVFDDPAVGAGGGPHHNVFAPDVSRPDAEAIEAFFRAASLVADYSRHDDRPRAVPHNASCNSIYRREAFEAVGGFTTGFWPSEDADLDYRVTRQGWQIMYVPAALVDHHRSGGAVWLAGMMRRYGWGQGTLVRWYGPFRKMDFVPPLVVVGLLLQLGLLVPGARAAVLALDVLGVAGVVGHFARHVTPRLWPGVLKFTVMAFAQWNLGYLEGLLAGPRSPQALTEEALARLPAEAARVS